MRCRSRNLLSGRLEPQTDDTDSLMIEAHLTEQLIGSFFRVYRDLGFGFLEPVYRNSLAVELQHCGIQSRREVLTEVAYRGVLVGKYRIDLLVEEKVLVEVKATKVYVTRMNANYSTT